MNIRANLQSKSRLSNNRILSGDTSLDSSLVANNIELILSHLNARKSSEVLIAEVKKVAQLRTERNSCISERDNALNARKTLSKDIGQLLKTGKTKEVEALKEQVSIYSSLSEAADRKIVEIDSQIWSIMSLVPNLLDDRVVDGHDEKDNVLISSWGEEKRLVGPEGTFLWHDDIAKKLGGADMEAAAKISGARFSVLVGHVARLERAITQYFLDFHVARGYTEVSVPFIVTRSTLQGTGQLPKFEEDLFKVSHNVAGEDAFLIPTAEVPVTNLFRDQILNATELPIKLVSLTPSFRAEAGSYGKDTKGLLRQHQFHKVELVKIVDAQRSNEEHEKLTNDAEDLLKSLQLPYRKMMLCSGDTGFSARICYDLEVWLPGQQAYREISSCSNCYDFQARRMMLRYRESGIGADGKKKPVHYAHTINGSGVAVGRALIAILENYQQPDGSVIVPDVLRPYMGGIDKLMPMPISSGGDYFPYRTAK